MANLDLSISPYMWVAQDDITAVTDELYKTWKEFSTLRDVLTVMVAMLDELERYSQTRPAPLAGAQGDDAPTASLQVPAIIEQSFIRQLWTRLKNAAKRYVDLRESNDNRAPAHKGTPFLFRDPSWSAILLSAESASTVGFPAQVKDLIPLIGVLNAHSLHPIVHMFFSMNMELRKYLNVNVSSEPILDLVVQYILLPSVGDGSVELELADSMLPVPVISGGCCSISDIDYKILVGTVDVGKAQANPTRTAAEWKEELAHDISESVLIGTGFDSLIVQLFSAADDEEVTLLSSHLLRLYPVDERASYGIAERELAAAMEAAHPRPASSAAAAAATVAMDAVPAAAAAPRPIEDPRPVAAVAAVREEAVPEPAKEPEPAEPVALLESIGHQLGRISMLIDNVEYTCLSKKVISQVVTTNVPPGASREAADTRRKRGTAITKRLDEELEQLHKIGNILIWARFIGTVRDAADLKVPASHLTPVEATIIEPSRAYIDATDWETVSRGQVREEGGQIVQKMVNLNKTTTECFNYCLAYIIVHVICSNNFNDRSALDMRPILETLTELHTRHMDNIRRAKRYVQKAMRA